MTSLELVALAIAAGAAASVAARALALRLALLSPPNPLVPAHREAIPYLGGVAVAVGTLLALTAFRKLLEIREAVVVGALAFLLIGLLDDLRPGSPARKLALQGACAALAIALGLRLPLTGIDAIDAVGGLLWILVVVNAVNLTDVCDGLVAGLAAIAFLAFAVSIPGSSPLALAAAGACLGFLVLNAPQASIFLGDGGSHFIGFCLAVLTLEPMPSRAAPEQVVAGMLVLGVPLFELAFVVVARARKGLPSWRASADHFALRLQAGGLSAWQTDVVAWTAAGGVALAGIALLRAHATIGLFALALSIVGAAAAWRQLLRWEPRAPTRA